MTVIPNFIKISLTIGRNIGHESENRANYQLSGGKSAKISLRDKLDDMLIGRLFKQCARERVTKVFSFETCKR
jgi:hypothetical protein